MSAAWNVVATVRGSRYRDAKHLLRDAGKLEETDFYNVLVVEAGDVDEFLAWLADVEGMSPQALECLAHVRPARATFDFQTAEEFEARAEAIALEWASRVAGKSFHVRMHRRGFKGRLDSGQEEKGLADTIFQCLESAGHQARVSFDDPDAILSVDTVANRAGMTLWGREELDRYPLLGLD